MSHRIWWNSIDHTEGIHIDENHVCGIEINQGYQRGDFSTNMLKCCVYLLHKILSSTPHYWQELNSQLSCCYDLTNLTGKWKSKSDMYMYANELSQKSGNS